MAYTRHKGFTLIELLAVLVVISVMVSLAVLSLGDGGKHDRLKEESNRLAALVRLANDQAVMEGREWGVRVKPDGYDFMVLKDGKWQAVKGDRMFRPRKLKEGFSMMLRMDDINVSLTPAVDGGGDSRGGKAGSPQVFLMSSAERTPFEVIISAPGGTPSMTVEAPLLGDIVVRDQDRSKP